MGDPGSGGPGQWGPRAVGPRAVRGLARPLLWVVVSGWALCQPHSPSLLLAPGVAPTFQSLLGTRVAARA